MGTHKNTREPLKMKQTIFLTLVVLAFSAMAQDEPTTTTDAATTTTAALATCTEADHSSEYTICQSLETSCTGFVAACSGLGDVCLETVAATYTAYLEIFDFTGVTTCACTDFTCSSTGVVYTEPSSTASLVASLGLIGLMKLFL